MPSKDCGLTPLAGDCTVCVKPFPFGNGLSTLLTWNEEGLEIASSLSVDLLLYVDARWFDAIELRLLSSSLPPYRNPIVSVT